MVLARLVGAGRAVVGEVVVEDDAGAMVRYQCRQHVRGIRGGSAARTTRLRTASMSDSSPAPATALNGGIVGFLLSIVDQFETLEPPGPATLRLDVRASRLGNSPLDDERRLVLVVPDGDHLKSVLAAVNRVACFPTRLVDRKVGQPLPLLVLDSKDGHPQLLSGLGPGSQTRTLPARQPGRVANPTASWFGRLCSVSASCD
jgi:hypothetical protein